MQPDEFTHFNYTKFRERVIGEANKRGAETPSWDDVWLTMARDSQIGEFLRERGVDTAELQNDILFIRLFGKPKLNIVSEEPGTSQQDEIRSIHTEIIEDLKAEITSFDSLKDLAKTPEMRKALDKLEDAFQKHAESIATDPKQRTHNEMKARLFHVMANDFLMSLEKLNTQPNMMLGAGAEAGLQEFADFLGERKSWFSTADNALTVLDTLMGIPEGMHEKGQIAGKPTLLFNVVRDASGDFYHYLLARNGMMVSDGYQPPCRMLPRDVCRLGMTAYNVADDERAKEVTPLHLARILLMSDPSVQAGIRELVREDETQKKKIEAPDQEEDNASQTELSDDSVENTRLQHISERVADVLGNIRKQIIPKPGGDEKFRVNITIPDRIKQLLYGLADTETETSKIPTYSRLFSQLLEYPEVKALLVNAGIDSAVVERWDEIQAEHIRQMEEARKLAGTDPVTDDDPSRFKVSDTALEGLIKAYGRDLTKDAAEGKLDPIVGRKKELNDTEEILLRRNKKNAVYLGEPGVGKTALFHGLAQRIVNGNVPSKLLGARVIELDLQAMNAGAMFRGQFEERLKGIIDGVAERNASGKFPPIILCIDELHAAMQAGTASGTPGASEMMKPALTRGDLYVVGSTTEREYRRYIEKDGALTRRFEPVIILEPTVAETIEVLKGLKAEMQAHHKVIIPDELLEKTAKLTHRYLSSHRSPDRDITILDMALAKAAKADDATLSEAHLLGAISQKSRLPLEFLKRDENARSLELPKTLREHVRGQEVATDAVAAAVISAKAGLQDQDKPVGSFLFRGPTGVGKTETAKALALNEFGGEDAMIRIDMSEYMEKHAVSRLIGAPPGYVGYEEEGQLTGPVSRRPYSVILLDEIEKAHPDVFNLLLQVLDDGRLTDGQGRTIDFRNTIIIMTTNHPDPKQLFRPEMLNRIDEVIEFGSLPRDVIIQLVERRINTLEARMKDQFGCELMLSDNAREQLIKEGYNPEYGARPLNRAVNKFLIKPLSAWLLDNNKSNVQGRCVLVKDIHSFETVIGDSKEALAAEAKDIPDTPEMTIDPYSIEESTKSRSGGPWGRGGEK